MLAEYAWGKKNRMNRIIQEDKRTLMFAVDHDYFLGPLDGIQKPKKAISSIMPLADALMLTRGTLESCVDSDLNKPIILRMDGGPTIAGEKNSDCISTLADHRPIVDLEDAIRLNATAIAVDIFVNTDYEAQTIQQLGHYVNEAKRYGIPVIAVTATGTGLDKLKEDSKYLALACRTAAAMGADIVKTYLCQEGFERVTAGCTVPVVMAGGKKMDTVLGNLQQVHKAVKEGAIGVDMGRNIFQDRYPVAMVQAVREIIHGGSTPEKASRLYHRLAKKMEPRPKKI